MPNWRANDARGEFMRSRKGSGPAWTVERIVPERDLDGLLEVETSSFSRGWTRAMYMEELEKNRDIAHIFVLRTPDQPVAGFCSCWLIYDELHINNLAVRPEYRRRGLGRALLVRVLEQGARLGARRATLEVRRSNLVAIRLYESLGFRVAGTRSRYYQRPEEDALVLWREGLHGPRSGESSP